MVKLVNQGDSIEGQKVQIYTRKPMLQTPVNQDGKIYYHYKLHINTKTTITEELNPKKYRWYPTSHLDKGDYLEGEIIELYTEKRLKLGKGSNYSSTHSIYEQEITDYTCAQIFRPWKFILEITSTR